MAQFVVKFFVTFLVLVFSGSFVHLLRQHRRLRHIKGPLLASLPSVWLFRSLSRGKVHLDLIEVCRKYGGIARIGSNLVVTSEPDLIRRMLSVRSKYRRSELYDALRLNPARVGVIAQRNDALHAKLRSQMVAGYSGKEVEDLESKIDTQVLNLIRLIEKYIAADKPLDFAEKANFFTVDVISDLAFGRAFGDLAEDADVYGYYGILEESFIIMIFVSAMPWLLKIIHSRFFRPWLPAPEDKDGIGRLLGFAREVCNERYGPNKVVKKDMLNSFISRKLTQPEAETEVLNQIAAGADTTSTVLRAIIMHLLANPRVFNNLRSEIENTSIPTTGVVSDALARSLPYLQATVKEGIRMWPPIAALLTKIVPKGGDSFNGIRLPDGTRIGYSAWAVMRDRRIWGEDADEFKPERWLRASGHELKRMEEIWEINFASSGKWGCMGKPIAMMELGKVTAELVRRFDMVIMDPLKPMDTWSHSGFLITNFWMKAYTREA